jgi:hypothetical protein
MPLLRLFAVIGALVAGAIVPAAAQARIGLTTGFSADSLLTGANAGFRAQWIPRAVSEGASIVRVNLVWSKTAPATRPAGFTASNPASPGYNWSLTDDAVRDLRSHGLQVLLNVSMAPTWAEGPGKPSSVREGTWEPDATQFAAFATAAAKRYSGTFPDPANPSSALPSVHIWQAWNEPNLEYYLAPQWTKSATTFTPASPTIYRGLLNAFYGAVKTVSGSNFVVTAGTAPYGDPPGTDSPGNDRMQPVAFDRGVFCLASDLSAVSCPNPPHLDALSHHPYAVGGPTWHAFNADDVAVADVYKIANVLKAAQKHGTVLPSGPKQLWDTEISWDSSPPDPQGVPIKRHARWVEQAMYVLWRQGVNTVLWLEIGDAPPVPSFAATYQAGMFYIDGRPKPAATAFKFPFVTDRKNKRQIRVWGRAPVGGKVKLEVKHGRHWTVLRKLKVRSHQVFFKTIKLRGRATLRAQIHSQTSLTWSQGR